MQSSSAERLEEIRPSDDEIEAMTRELEELRKTRGEKPREMPDLRLEKQELADKNESVYEKVKGALKKAFDFLVIKPVKWVGHQIKEHPIRTALIALAAFALWYYSAPLSAGLSGIKEAGIKATSDLMAQDLAIDPTQINVFDQLMSGAAGTLPTA